MRYTCQEKKGKVKIIFTYNELVLSNQQCKKSKMSYYNDREVATTECFAMFA